MQLNISYNAWIRTTQTDHETLVCNFLQRVKSKGDIYKDTYEGYYCVGCEKYMDEEEMEGDHVCKVHKTTCELRKEENHFFRLSRSVTVYFNVFLDCFFYFTREANLHFLSQDQSVVSSNLRCFLQSQQQSKTMGEFIPVFTFKGNKQTSKSHVCSDHAHKSLWQP